MTDLLVRREGKARQLHRGFSADDLVTWLQLLRAQWVVCNLGIICRLRDRTTARSAALQILWNRSFARPRAVTEQHGSGSRLGFFRSRGLVSSGESNNGLFSALGLKFQNFFTPELREIPVILIVNK